ncbi:MAG: inorganic diphosphatase [Buchnera aphidicola (Periphyllus lyropictus)]|uniref:inorganic diphosphatase n=1 Tax=Buchnera aphidicola TaxID=9 RepID=UPI001EB4B39A|nr:inorganic diphosphatase [Buchnera aphidicola]NIH16743.1 inorganic diphosphatase [Buchnera aphidicola (Periphyllus lyropictus)]USS94643.1 inorganic diphosphatase [Buchnera aphidicola (Periphyllus lyropictus)]
MNLKKIKPGKNVPNDVYVIIEIQAHSKPIKYEINKKNKLLMVDRIIPTSMFYPCNYGFINKTLSLDGDPLDALVITPYPLIPYSIIQCKPIGMLNMKDESGIDYKIICVPTKKICKEYKLVNDIQDLPKNILKNISHFFKYYKKLEKKKWTEILKWKNSNESKKEIIKSIKRYKKKKK